MNTKSKISLKVFYLAFAFLFVFTINTFAQETAVDFESDQWVVLNGRKLEHEGRSAFMGIAYLKDVEFENGTIEVDFLVTPETRSYPGVIFRMQDRRNYERFYIRPHREPFYPDALQYVAAFNGLDSWQMYSGEGETAMGNFPENEWFRIKIEVSGSQAKVYVVDMDNPALVIKHLQHGESIGTIGLYGPPNGTAYFSNFKYKIDNSLKFEPAPEEESIPGTLTDWSMSQVFKYTEVDIEKYPDKKRIDELKWQDIKPLKDGLVDLSRYTGRTSQEPNCVYLKTNIYSDKDQNKIYQFGYSDIVTIFLNGEFIYLGNSAYQSRDRSFLGIIGYFDYIGLPLKKGNNEMMVILLEAFGGWGLKFRENRPIFEHSSMSKKWEIDNPDLKMGESALYDKKRNILYVTNYDMYGAPNQQFLSRVTLDGKIETLKWVEKLNKPTGMLIHADKLYVVERTNVVEIDIDKGEILNRYKIPAGPGMFPNDIAVDKSGNMYISDSNRSIIFKLSNGEFVEWLKSEEIVNPNGLWVYDNKLIAGISGTHSILKIDLSTKNISKLVSFDSGIMDGIKVDKKGNYIISIYEGIVYRVTPSGEYTKLLHIPDSRTTDFEYIADKNLLVIPSLEENVIRAYEYK
ncbi:SMP-30/gluconolactonase/LRE family protein [candidate division KSB1 bacterium]